MNNIENNNIILNKIIEIKGKGDTNLNLSIDQQVVGDGGTDLPGSSQPGNHIHSNKESRADEVGKAKGDHTSGILQHPSISHTTIALSNSHGQERVLSCNPLVNICFIIFICL